RFADDMDRMAAGSACAMREFVPAGMIAPLQGPWCRRSLRHAPGAPSSIRPIRPRRAPKFTTMYSDQLKLLLIHLPKTGGESISGALQGYGLRGVKHRTYREFAAYHGGH